MDILWIVCGFVGGWGMAVLYYGHLCHIGVALVGIWHLLTETPAHRRRRERREQA